MLHVYVTGQLGDQALNPQIRIHDQKRKFKVTFDEINHVPSTQIYHRHKSHGSRQFLSSTFAISVREMLVSPALAFLTLVINFYAIIHIVSNRSGLTARTKTGSKWQVLYVDIFPLEEATTATYETDLDTTALPPLASPPIYSTTLHQAEWAYRSSAVRILDLVDGTQKVRTAPGVITPPSRYQSSPSPTKQTDPIVSTGHLPPTLTSPIYPATFKPFPTYNPSIPSVATSSVAQSLGFTGFVSCLAYALVFVWMKVGGPPRS